MPDHKPTNVLLICVDQWPGSLLGCAGHPVIKTPVLDQLAANGVRYTNCYSECPVSVPARKTIMTGLTPRMHRQKDNAHRPFPEVTTLARAFRDAGYQACAVGKLHLENQRSRIGFDDVLLDEEGRAGEGVLQDDYELWLGDHGYPGQRFAHGMCNNTYLWRPWHLPERYHVTNWAAQQMCRTLKRRDRTRPGFWYLSFSHPHPPLAPLQAYLDMYRDSVPPEPHIGDWALCDDATPERVKQRILQFEPMRPNDIADARRAFYALCTHIDHQVRTVIGTLREEGLINNTVIMFTADHGDMLGNHNQWAKDQMHEDSHCVPMILAGAPIEGVVGHHRTDGRLTGLADVMPTLLSLAGLHVPEHVEGLDMTGDHRREFVFGEWGYDERATRMVRDSSHKLVYFPWGNQFLLFDMERDPDELRNLAASPEHAGTLERLTNLLIDNMDDEDAARWIRSGRLTGMPIEAGAARQPSHGMQGQRGTHWPPPVSQAPWA